MAADLLGTSGPPQDPRAAKFFNPSRVDPATLAQLRTSSQGAPLAPLPQAGKLDSFLNILGTAGQFAGALNRPQQPRAPVATMGQFYPQKKSPWEGVQF